MNTYIRPQYLVSFVLLFTMLMSACMMPVAPTSESASVPAASGGRGASDAGSEASSAYERPASEGAAAPAGEAAADSSYSPRRPSADSAAMPDRTGQYETVTAGVTDDNVEWQAYLDYLGRNRRIYANQRDVSERYIIQVIDEAGLTVHDATVEIYAGDQQIFSGRTDAGGRVLFHPLALDNRPQTQRSADYRVVATKGYVARSETFHRYQGEQWTITIDSPERLAYAQLDLLFLIDATGSMGDEIDKLKATMADIADQIALLPEQPDLRYGLVAYRDRGDAFVVRSYDFTPNLRDFQRTLAALRADGGGDEPEALNEALHRSIHELSWRSEDTVRLAILVADAPPHLDYRWENFSYDSDMIEAVRLGIKIFPVGASNLNSQGEYIFRQLAQFTGGKFVFLTYADGSNPGSGPGTETDHDVDNYSVDTLDRLVVRLVRDELAKLAMVVNGGVPVAQQQHQPSPVPTPTPKPVLQPVNCTVDLLTEWTDCDRHGVVQVLEQRNGQRLLQLTLDPERTGYDRVRFDITYVNSPRGWSVNIGDSISNNGDAGDSRDQSNDAEVQIKDGVLTVFGNDDTPATATIDGYRQLLILEDAVRSGETISLEVANERLGINASGGIQVVDLPYLFALNNQLDYEGRSNYDIFAAFNRTISGAGRNGSGVSQVVVTLYPAR